MLYQTGMFYDQRWASSPRFSGAALASLGKVPLTGVRVSHDGNWVTALQLKYGTTWSPVYGASAGNTTELQFDGVNEYITEVTMWRAWYFDILQFTTNFGRSAGVSKEGYSGLVTAAPCPGKQIRLAYVSGIAETTGDTPLLMGLTLFWWVPWNGAGWLAGCCHSLVGAMVSQLFLDHACAPCHWHRRSMLGQRYANMLPCSWSLPCLSLTVLLLA